MNRCLRTIPNEPARGVIRAIFDNHFCNKPASWRAYDGRPLCDEHAEELVRALQNPNTLGSILGGRALTEKQARARVWRIQ